VTNRIVHLTTVHRWNDTRIFRKECQSLAASGYDTVLAAPREQSGNLNAVRLIALPHYQRRLVRLLVGSIRILRTAIRMNADLYHFHDPELIGVAFVLKFIGKTVVYDVHEDVSEQILSKHWIPTRLRRLASRCFRRFECAAARRVDGIVAATPAIARRFPSEKTVIVQNFPVVGELDRHTSMDDKRRSALIAYMGVISRERGICEVVQAIGQLPYPDIRLAMAGQFSSPELEAEVHKMAGWNRVDFLGWCDRPQLATLLSEAVAGVVTFLPAANHIESQPNKLFEYMSAGLPVVASDFPLWREIVEKANCGLLVDPAQPQEIADAITWLVEHPDEAREMGRRGRQAVLSKYNWDREFEVLLDFYRRILKEDHTSSAEPGTATRAA
jgi:glycosyltransferase involved in cell wall biosynthesis